MESKTNIAIISVLLLLLAAAVAYVFYPQLQFSNADQSATETSIEDEVRAELKDESTDAIYSDIEQDFAALENEYEFNEDFTAGEFNVPEFEEDFNATN